MSLYLAIESATDAGSVAVGEPGRVLCERRFSDMRHATALAPAVDEVLREAGADYASLAGIVVADGPGSFTGLRIGFATAKGVLRVHGDVELRTAPSLLAAAWGARREADGPVAALYDALRGDVFAAVYDVSGAQVRKLLAPVCWAADELERRSPVKPALAVGDGAAAYADLVRDWTGREPLVPPDGAPRAGALIELLAVEEGTGLVDDPDNFQPAYGRRAAAQVKWEREHGRPLPHPGGTTD